MSPATVSMHEFTVKLSGDFDDQALDRASVLYVSGCDDASLWSEGSTAYLTFHREAESRGRAIGSAVDDVERAGFSVAAIGCASLEDA